MKKLLTISLIALIALTSVFAAITTEENELVLTAEVGGISAGAILNSANYATVSAKTKAEFYNSILAFDPSNEEKEDLGLLPASGLTDKAIGGIVFYSTEKFNSQTFTITSANASKLKHNTDVIPYTIKVDNAAYTFGTATEMALVDYKFAKPLSISIAADAIAVVPKATDYTDTLTIEFKSN